MARAEVGTPKYIANKMKSKGLQRLRWYCQVCEKQCRDENGFKCHTQSESHIRQMLLIGENPNKKIEEYSNQLKSDFLRLLRLAHGEKPINANRFYQEYIGEPDHIHMNATSWPNLSEFVKYLGKEGLCRVSETEKDGVCIAYIDTSPEALQRQEALRKHDKSKKGDEEISQKILQKQIDLAEKSKKSREYQNQETPEELELRRDENSVPLKLNISLGVSSTPQVPSVSKSAIGFSTGLISRSDNVSLDSKNSTTITSKPSTGGFFKGLAVKNDKGKPVGNIFNKRPSSDANIKKPASSIFSKGGSGVGSSIKKPLNAFEKVMMIDQQRQQRRA